MGELFQVVSFSSALSQFSFFNNLMEHDSICTSESHALIRSKGENTELLFKAKTNSENSLINTKLSNCGLNSVCLSIG